MILIAPLLVFLLLVAPGVRLLTLAIRTRQAPEIWGGLYFIGASSGLSLRVLGVSLHDDHPGIAETFNTIGHASFALGTIAMTIFTLRVFHATSRGARVFAGVTMVAIVMTTAHTLLAGNASIEASISMAAANFARLIPTSWAFFESFRYWRSMRRRQMLGLADPVLTNRFLLWSIWTGAVTLMPLVALAIRSVGILWIGEGDSADQLRASWMPITLGVVRILFLVIAPIAALALSFCFFPPAFYLDRVRGQARKADGRAAA